jgi:hypothetical protein
MCYGLWPLHAAELYGGVTSAPNVRSWPIPASRDRAFILLRKG